MKRDAFPLQWPDGWARTRARSTPKFVSSFARDRDEVLRQVAGMNGRHGVITSNLPTRGDGLPYANAPKYIDDPGVALWWVDAKTGRERVVACDRWFSVGDNLRAISKTLDAMRGIARWGATEAMERAFAGFAALPPGADDPGPVAPAARPWREVLEVPKAWSSLPSRDLAVLVKARHRELIAANHPDRGGDPIVAAAINAAAAAAEMELR